MYDTYPASAGLAVKSLSFFPQLLFVKKGGVFHLSRPHSHTERCLKVQLLSSCFFFLFFSPDSAGLAATFSAVGTAV